MDLDRIITRLLENPEDLAVLRRVGHQFGASLLEASKDFLARFRVRVSTTISHPEESFARGYLQALQDVAAAYEQQLNRHQLASNLQSQVIQADLGCLLEPLLSAATPTMVAKTLGKPVEQVHTDLNKLESLGIVECDPNTREAWERITKK